MDVTRRAEELPLRNQCSNDEDQSGIEQPSTRRLGVGRKARCPAVRPRGGAAIPPASLVPKREAVGAESGLLLNPRRRMERVSPEGKCDEASQQQKAATGRDQDMRERHLGTSQLKGFMRSDMRRNLAIKSTSKLICPAGRRRTARKVAGTALCPPFDFRAVVQPLGCCRSSRGSSHRSMVTRIIDKTLSTIERKN
ncbi:hypothetical protein [Bradyrhizobium elkanii]|uniref:hypothetical protein n=1 Tax=Bradyrhizobium elkanii TaxID=29448 RepID=UPI00209DAA3D|nr:hypothetical protein [Bradyrhizobium elkanii]MCS3521045.1 hypothetical protein [Bradyrhizobium elkanii]MCS4068702.1 hypothetical protein [Bradyrhizobium elkanii]MCS4084236.1 hypothetical protein [Bradyrhizobium elkanii]MCS4104498.1 hypothetical protein [Bradyrhizobium elkanii]MCW2126097.1 hypothetical protein [Bradyrhizobium elkanii]